MTTKILKQIENVRMYLREQRIHCGIAPVLDEIAADLRTHLASPVPEGWVMVPREPDLKMVIAGENRIGRHAYQAMLAAAPPAPKEHHL